MSAMDNALVMARAMGNYSIQQFPERNERLGGLFGRILGVPPADAYSVTPGNSLTHASGKDLRGTAAFAANCLAIGLGESPNLSSIVRSVDIRVTKVVAVCQLSATHTPILLKSGALNTYQIVCHQSEMFSGLPKADAGTFVSAKTESAVSLFTTQLARLVYRKSNLILGNVLKASFDDASKSDNRTHDLNAEDDFTNIFHTEMLRPKQMSRVIRGVSDEIRIDFVKRVIKRLAGI